MKTGNLRKVSTIIFCLLFFAMFAVPAFAKSGGTIKSAKQVLGYCVAKGAISHISESACKKRHGVFFKKKQDAQAYLDAQTPGYCCLDGKVLSMKKGDCLKKKGHFFKDKKEATIYCDLHQTGYCCLDGKITKMLKGNCLKKKGKFFLTQKAARDTCDPLGWCLLKGKVHHTRKSACEKKKGKFFIKKTEADKAARSVSVGAKEKERKKRTGRAGIVSPGLAGARPYLTVERLYLRKVENYYLVCVDIKNRGRGKLTKEDYNKGALALRREGSKWHWPLFKVDKKGDLNRGKTVSYATGAIISAPTTVQIYFMHIPGGTKSARLAPPIGEYVKGAKKVPTGAAIPARPMRAARKPGKSATIPGPGRMMGRKVKPEFKVPDAVPKSLDAGIRILSPTSRAKFYAGETIQIRYRITRPGFSADQITFTVMKSYGGRWGIVTVPWGTNPVSLTLLEDISDVSGTYYIFARARNDSEEIHGTSDEFEIHQNSAQIEFIRPTAGEAAHRGGHLTILYRLSRRVSPGPVTFELHSLTSSTVFASTTVDYRPPLPEGGLSRLYLATTLEIPSTPSEGDDYFITATHAKALGTSDTFSIRAFGEGHGEQGVISIQPMDITREDGPVWAKTVKAKINVQGTDTPLSNVKIQVEWWKANHHPDSSVHTSIVEATLQPGMNEVVLDTFGVPYSLASEAVRDLFCGRRYKVTIDPEYNIGLHPEWQYEKTIYYYDSKVRVRVVMEISHHSGPTETRELVETGFNNPSSWHSRHIYAEDLVDGHLFWGRLKILIENFGAEPIGSNPFIITQSWSQTAGDRRRGGRLGEYETTTRTLDSTPDPLFNGRRLDIWCKNILIDHLTRDAKITITPNDPVLTRYLGGPMEISIDFPNPYF